MKRILIALFIFACFECVASIPLEAEAAPALEWVKQFSFTSSFDPDNQSLGHPAVDPWGNVYIVGRYNKWPKLLLFVKKFDASGNELWTGSVHDGDPYVANEINCSATDLSGSVYIVGSTGDTIDGQPLVGGSDGFIKKYDRDGRELWTRQFGTSADDNANAAAVDEFGNVYIVGSTEGQFPGMAQAGLWDAFICKYDANGNELWARQFGGPNTDGLAHIAIDGSNRIDAAGREYIPGGFGDSSVLLCQYDSDGNQRWNITFDNPVYIREYASEVLADKNDDIYVVATGMGYYPLLEAGFVRKFNANGTELWNKDISKRDYDNIYDGILGGNNDLYMAGSISGALPGQAVSQGHDITLRNIDASSQILWNYQFGTSGDDYGSYIIANRNSSSVYLAGRTSGLFPGNALPSAFYIAKFSIGFGEASGRIVDLRGRVIPKATIRLDNIPITFDAKTGRFIAGMMPGGAHTIYYDAPGYVSQTQTATISEGATAQMPTCILSAIFSKCRGTGKIRGRLVDQRGRRIKGALVRIDNTILKPNRSGYFTFTKVVPGVYTIFYDAPGYRGQTLSVEAKAKRTTRLPKVILTP